MWSANQWFLSELQPLPRFQVQVAVTIKIKLAGTGGLQAVQCRSDCGSGGLIAAGGRLECALIAAPATREVRNGQRP